MITPESSIAIVGAGVFGLSTALHLAKRGYHKVTVFDFQPYHQNAYDPDSGCDSASSDLNKIYRCSYGREKEYQDLAFSGRPVWLEWNRMIASTPAQDLPKGLTPETKLFEPCGYLKIANESRLSPYDLDSLQALEEAGLRHWQHIIGSLRGDESDMRRLAEQERNHPDENWSAKLKAHQEFQGGKLAAYLDTSAGFTYADKACAWVRHICETLGVQFILGQNSGNLDELLSEGSGDNKSIHGLRMADGTIHHADVTVIACGGWSPGLVPELEGLLETTAGSVVTIQLPQDRSDLWDKFSPERFPVWTYGLTGHESSEYGGQLVALMDTSAKTLQVLCFYGFPRTTDGRIKIGYRGRKWTNYQTHHKTQKRLSVPKTKYTVEKAYNLPKKALYNLKKAIAELLPELTEIGITETRLCWYTDSLDNSFLVDYVPGYNNSLFVASGGSGHGFKFLPILGDHVVNQLEGKGDQFTPLWKWRISAPGSQANGLEEGEFSGRNLADLEIADEKDWKWETENGGKL